MRAFCGFGFVALCVLLPFGFSAQASSLFESNTFIAARLPLVGNGQISLEEQIGREQASLFADRQAGGLFAPVTRAAPLARGGAFQATNGAGVAGLRNLIASVEAGRAGYDAVVWSAAIKTPKPPTQMTVAEIFAWIKATPGQNHAIGRYQFIPNTLRRLVKQDGVAASSRFTPAVQDRLANILLEDAGFSRFVTGTLPRKSFMNNLARIWAGLPNSTGKSHYHGIAGNAASMSWARFDGAMKKLFPS